MPQLLVWECPRSKKLFRSKAIYKKHLKQLALTNIETKNRQARIEANKEILAQASQCYSGQELAEWILEHAADLMFADQQKVSFKYRDDIQAGATVTLPTIKSVHFSSVRYLDSVSNSHSRPRDGVCNWSRQPDKPLGYPGWAGRISLNFDTTDIVLTNKKGTKQTVGSISASDLLSSINVNTGSGGGGMESRYELRLYSNDFPNMRGNLAMELLKTEGNVQIALDAIGTAAASLKEPDYD